MEFSGDNKLTAKQMVDGMNKEDALVVLLIAQKENGNIIIETDGRMSHLLIADALEAFAKGIRNKYSNAN